MGLRITINVNGRNEEISIGEARILFGDLQELFGEQIPTYTHHYEPQHTDRVYEESIPHEVHGQPVHERRGPDEPTLNPKVEAARERARKRTSGCGSRR